MVTVKILNLGFSWVFNFILAPFDLGDLLRAFSRRGYEVLMKLPPVPFGGKVGGAGVIARRNDFEIYVNTDRQIIGVRGAASFDELDPIVQNVKAILVSDFDVDFSQNLWYCEVLASLKVMGEDVIEKMRKVPIKDVPELREIIGEYGLVGFRIGSRGSLPTQSNWFDIEVHPEWANPTKFFTISIVYRNVSEENVILLARKLEEVALYLLRLI